MMAFDMTAQLVPVVWGMFGLLLASAVGIIATALQNAGSGTQPAKRPTPRLHPVSMTASA